MKSFQFILMGLLAFIGLSSTGCGALKAFKKHVSGVDEISVTKPVQDTPKPVKKTQAVKTSSVVQTPTVRPQRSPYDSIADDGLGSIWTEKGQENFYFSRNTRRRTGDIIILKVGSDIDDLVAEKFRSYFTRLEAQKTAQKPKGKTTTATPVAPPPEEEKVEVGDVTMRLVKALDRGSFEVTGQKPMYFKGKKFDVTISGIVKLEDINADDTITSARLLESNVLLGGGTGL